MYFVSFCVCAIPCADKETEASRAEILGKCWTAWAGILEDEEAL